MNAPFSKVPTLPAALGMSLGVMSFCLWPDAWHNVNWILPFCFFFIGLATFFLKGKWLLFVCLFALVGCFSAVVHAPLKAPQNTYGVKKEYWARVINAESNPQSCSLLVEVDSCTAAANARFKASLSLINPERHYLPGDRVTFTAKFQKVDSLTDLPDENKFQYKHFVNGVAAQAVLASDDISIVGSVNTIGRSAKILSEKVSDLICRMPVATPTAWLIAATLIGDDSNLDGEAVEQFRATGTAHYLALSGFHVGVIALLVSMVLFPLRAFGKVGRFRHLIVIVFVWIYAFVCGLSPSLVRAAVFVTVYLLAGLLQRQSSPYNSLCVAAVVILVFSPRQLFAPGFQLSFAAVLAILLFAERLNPVPQRKRFLHAIAAMFTLPFSAMLGTCLITAVHFHRLPLLFLLPNLLFGILLPLFIFSAAILTIVMAAGGNSPFLAALLDWIAGVVNGLSNYFASFPYAEIKAVYLPWWAIGPFVLAIVAAALALHQRRKTYWLFCAVFIALGFGLSRYGNGIPTDELYVTRQSLRTDLLIRTREQFKLITTAPRCDYECVVNALSRRYKTYLERRGVKELTIAEGDFTEPNVMRRGDYVLFRDKLILFPMQVDTIDIYSGMTVDFMLVSRTMGEHAWGAIKAIHPNAVILSCDVPEKRLLQIVDSCEAHSIKSIQLNDGPFVLH